MARPRRPVWALVDRRRRCGPAGVARPLGGAARAPGAPAHRAPGDGALEPRGATLLGISFRPRQVEALGLDAPATLRTLLSYPFQLIRLGAYWNRMEPAPGVFLTHWTGRSRPPSARASRSFSASAR